MTKYKQQVVGSGRRESVSGFATIYDLKCLVFNNKKGIERNTKVQPFQKGRNDEKPFLKKPRHSWDLLDKDVESTILKYAQRAKGNHVQRIKEN